MCFYKPFRYACHWQFHSIINWTRLSNLLTHWRFEQLKWDCFLMNNVKIFNFIFRSNSLWSVPWSVTTKHLQAPGTCPSHPTSRAWIHQQVATLNTSLTRCTLPPPKNKPSLRTKSAKFWLKPQKTLSITLGEISIHISCAFLINK